MIEALILLNGDRSIIGRFNFEVAPRIGEEITIPWPGDESGVRIFDIDGVSHRSIGLQFDDDFPAGNLVLYVTEIG